MLMMLAPVTLAALGEPVPCSARRRHLISSLTTAAVLAAPSKPAAAFELPDNFIIPSPFGILSYGLNQRAEQQEACYNAGECADAVPYYQLECERSDKECLARKRRLASREITAFLENPTSSPALLVFGFVFFSGPFAALLRFTRALWKALTSMDDDDDPSSPPPPQPPPPPPPVL